MFREDVAIGLVSVDFGRSLGEAGDRREKTR